MLYFIWFEVGVISRELGFQQSALSATELYVLALLVWPLQSLLSLLVSHSDPLFFPHRSPSLPLFHCCCCSWPCLQMSTRTEQLFSMGQAPHPSFIHSHTHTRCHVWMFNAFIMWMKNINTQRRMKYAAANFLEYRFILQVNSLGGGWASYPFQTWINVTDTCTHTDTFLVLRHGKKPSHPPPPMQCRYRFSCSVWWWRGVEGGGRGMWDGTPVGSVYVCLCVCVSCSSVLAGSAHWRKSISHLYQCGAAPTTPCFLSLIFFSPLSAEAAALPPSPPPTPIVPSLQTKSWSICPTPLGKTFYFSLEMQAYNLHMQLVYCLENAMQ